MRRHPLFVCFLMILIGNQQLRADDRLPTAQRKISTPAASYDQSTGKYLPLEPMKSAPGEILEQWSAASRFLSPATLQSKVEEFKKGNQTYFSGHELSLISEFQQPITAQALVEDYTWQLVRQTETSIILRGQPRDALTRHLCRPFELKLNPQSMLPEALTFLSDPAKQKQGFASIELTALKVLQTGTITETDVFPKTVSRRVAKAIFPQEAMAQTPASQTSPIKRISFSRLSSENRNETELQEIEKLVARWITESQRVESIKFGPITISRTGNRGPLSATIEENEPGANLAGTRRPSVQDILRPWLINVDRQTFVVESFLMDLSTDEKSSTAPRFITLIMKPDPNHRQPEWGTVEIEFSSVQPLPIKISVSHDSHMSQFLLSNPQIRYAE